MKYIIIGLAFLTFAPNSYAQNLNGYYVMNPGSRENHTEVFQQAFKQDKPIHLEPGDYHLDYNKLKAYGKLELRGEVGVRIYGIGTPKYKSTKPSALIRVVSPQKIIISNLSFFGEGNSATAIAIYKEDYLQDTQTEIKIVYNSTSEIGLIWIGPQNGFTFNRNYNVDRNWSQAGPIYQNKWESHVVISNNTCRGDQIYHAGNFSGSSVSAITLLYVKNAYVFKNSIDNFRFGIWSYGGASRTEDEKYLSKNPILSENINVYKNVVTETFSPIWFSKTKNVKAYDNITFNNQDVAMDVEGCRSALFYGNQITNSRGGALVALNGSEGIFFKRNRVTLTNFNKHNNIVLIRDGNKNINYINNSFVFYDRRLLKRDARVLIKNSSNVIRKNTEIHFRDNEFHNVYFEERDGSEVKKTSNSFKHD